MQIVTYTIVITTVRQQDPMLVESILAFCFCPLFVAHGPFNSVAVCEDSIYFENNMVYYKNYENYLQSIYNNLSAITIKKCGPSECSEIMINDIHAMIRYNEQMGIHYVFKNYNWPTNNVDDS
ncbi:orf127 [Artaxa digramma nucleopolyhedrovirus]|uniref:Orf127 n=1 Tax=Artaxa digramma nucleopolyhedrovirus TaxID=3070910 RepID=A0AAE6UZL0_9ABAC|nr:orf127 [Euproctis digramma nucleopolyhedrovirus]QHB21786.1 orf127 [Artaxa digramma nucleopolyhedrovirus]